MIEVIGTTEDIKRGAIINFVWSQDGMHFISLDYGDGSNYKYIVRNTSTSALLDFQRNKRIKANMVGDMLYWNDGYTSPHKVNIEKAIKYYLGEPWGYPYLTDAVISAIKFAPESAPRTYFSTNLELKGNNIRGKTYQFKYRYVYDDYEISICSPASKVVISTDIYDFKGNLFSPSAENNVLNVALSTGDISVTGMQLFARENNTADWFLVAHIKKSELTDGVTSYVYEFTNSEAFLAVDQIDVNRQYEYLPDLADTQEFIEGKYMGYGGITEGQELVEIDVDFSVDTTVVKSEESEPEFEYITEITGFDYTYNYLGEIQYGAGTFVRIYGINSGLPADQYISIDYRIEIDLNITSFGTIVYKTGPDDIDAATLRTHLAGSINGEIYSIIGWGNNVSLNISDAPGAFMSSWDQAVPDDEIWVFPYFGGSTTSPAVTSLTVYKGTGQSDLVAPRSYPAVKTGAYHKLGLIYIPKSGAKKSTVNRNQKCNVYVPTIIDLALDKTSGNGIIANIKWEINHQPPLWAYSYQWVYAGSSIEWFVQFVIGVLKETTSGPPIEESLDGNFVYINLSMLNKLQTQPPDGVDFTNTGSNVLPYEYKQGDRIRILTQQVDTNNDALQFPVVNLATELIDLEILGYETQAIEGVDVATDRIKVANFNFSPLLLGEGSVIEIYTPKKRAQDDIYYEIGECYPIINPGTESRAHGGQSGNQVFELGVQEFPATGVFTKMGAYVVTRRIPFNVDRYGALSDWNMDNSKLFFAESMNYNDFFSSEALDYGNPNVFDPEARRVKTNTVRRSKAYFEGTATNGLSTFYYDNYITLTSKWGAITAMEMIGGTLKVVFERKQTSIYIGANSLRQAKLSGVDVVVSSDNVFGSQNESESQFGTTCPESVIVVGRHLYFYDQNNSCIVRDAANGPINISELFKIRTWLESISPILSACDYKRVVSGYSAKYEEVWISFYAELNGVVTLSETIVFDTREQSTGFRFVDLNDIAGKTMDAYCSLSNELFGYREAELYQFDAGNYREFLGVKYPYLIEFVSNINPATRKIFNAVAVNSSQLWYAKDYGDVFVGSGYQGVQPMSKLFPANFRKKEGVWYAPLNRNARHKTGFYTVDSLYNGEHMRGESLGMRLICESDSEVTLHSVIVKCTVSEKTY